MEERCRNASAMPANAEMNQIAHRMSHLIRCAIWNQSAIFKSKECPAE
jgi:hypothetical protein